MTDEDRVLKGIREIPGVKEDEVQKVFDAMMSSKDLNKIDLILTRLYLRGERTKQKGC